MIKTIRFAIRRPDKTRRTFSIIKDVVYVNGSRNQKVLEDPRVEVVNLKMQRGLLTPDSAWAELKGSVVPALKHEAGVKAHEALVDQISANNLKVFQSFWGEMYAGVDLKNPASTRNDLLAALRAIDPLSVTTASRQDLRDKLTALPAYQQRRHCIRINQLLRHLERGFTIGKRSREYQDVDYVTWRGLQEMLPFIYSSEVQLLAIALFGTGVRIGEAFAPGFTRLKPNNTIYIDRQMDLKCTIRGIKNGKPHHTRLLPEAEAGYRDWCKVPHKERFRSSAINQIIRASAKAFPPPGHQISAHDLRHSYAIHMLGLGASLTQVAQLLGDSIATVELHYTGFVLTDEMVAGINKLFD